MQGGNAAPFILKAQLLQVLQLSDEERTYRLLSLNGLRDSKPTELMENMIALLGAGDAMFLFVQLFLWQLPTLVRTVLVSSPLVCMKDYRGLSEEADRMLLASHQTVMAAVADRAPERRDPTQRYDSRFGRREAFRPCPHGPGGSIDPLPEFHTSPHNGGLAYH